MASSVSWSISWSRMSFPVTDPSLAISNHSFKSRRLILRKRLRYVKALDVFGFVHVKLIDGLPCHTSTDNFQDKAKKLAEFNDALAKQIGITFS
jgi:hypothetical protein